MFNRLSVRIGAVFLLTTQLILAGTFDDCKSEGPGGENNHCNFHYSLGGSYCTGNCTRQNNSCHTCQWGFGGCLAPQGTTCSRWTETSGCELGFWQLSCNCKGNWTVVPGTANTVNDACK